MHAEPEDHIKPMVIINSFHLLLPYCPTPGTVGPDNWEQNPSIK